MAVESLAEALHRGLVELAGAEFSPGQEASLLEYLALLERWNGAYNLTAVKSPRDMIVRHVLDSLAVLPWVGSGRLLDAGTGAGLPGIPLAIALPDLEVFLLDSAGKKIRFLNHVRRALGLENTVIIQGRLESHEPDSREPDPAHDRAACYDAVISRAFADLAGFARAARHLALPPTRLLAMKGRYPESELKALPDWVRVDSVEKLRVPGLQEERHLVMMAVIP